MSVFIIGKNSVMSVVILQYNAGNNFSVQSALNRLGVDSEVTAEPEKLLAADRVIIPGVGEASSAMRSLRESGLVDVVRNLKQPVLGICLGLQIFCQHSEENDTACLGIFDEKVKKFTRPRKIPHMGWNRVVDLKGPLFKGLSEGAQFYFVHSFYAELGEETDAVTDYEELFSASLSKDNFYAVQFHPEKSAAAGSKVIENFLQL